MTLKDRWNRFLERATELHGCKFTYFEEGFVKYKTPMKIVCPIHGEFMQAPDKHVAKNSKGCPQCWEAMKRDVINALDRTDWPKKEGVSKIEFLERASKKFESKFTYDLSEYNGVTGAKIKIICPSHGAFYSYPSCHLQCLTGCKKCGKELFSTQRSKNYDFVLFQLQEKHSSFYLYPEHNREKYVNKRSKIDIICPKHGAFQKSAQKHLSGQGCWGCKVDDLIRNNILVGGYSERLFKEKPELLEIKGVLYYLKINDGEFYKIGISRHSAVSRFNAIKSKSQGKIRSIELIWEEVGTLYECFRKEQRILTEYAEHRVFENWSTELFNIDVFNARSE